MGNKKISKPRIAAILGSILLGTSLVTVGGLKRENVKIEQYEEISEQADYTILVYMNGSNLESDYGAAGKDLDEMQDALCQIEQVNKETDKDIRVNIVVEAGGCEEWQYEPLENKSYSRFLLSSKGIKSVTDMEVRDMSRSNTLADFINYGTQSYPAKYYGIVFWNHGAGQIEGFGSDSNFDNAAMPLSEIRQGFEKSELQEKFAFVSFDACLMGNLELAACLYDKADYLIASEELEPEAGHDYCWITEVTNPETEKNPGLYMGKKMVAAYEEYYKDNDFKLTLSLMDLGSYELFHDSFHKYLEEMTKDYGDGEWTALWDTIGRNRQSLQCFGNRTGIAAEIVDLTDLLEVFGKDGEKYDQLIDVINQLVVEHVSKGYEKEPTGLSIYLPSGANNWLKEDIAAYEGIPFCEIYQGLVKEYSKWLLQEQKIEWKETETENNEVRVSIEAESLKNLCSAYLATFYETGYENVVCLIGTDSDVTFNQEGFLKAEPETVGFGLKGELLSFIEVFNAEYYTEYMAPVLYNGELCTLTLAFDEENPDGKMLAVTPVDVSKQQYEIKAGDVLVPLYPIETTGDVSEKLLTDAEDMYQGNYYMGDEIQIEAEEDCMIEQVEINKEQSLYGFLLVDNHQRMCYTEIVK